MKKLVAALGSLFVLVALFVGPSGPAGAGDVALASSRVSVAGSPAAGSVLTVVPADWTSAPDRRTYEWLWDGEGDVLSHDPTYTMTPADVGHTLVVVERVWFGTVQDETSSTPVAVGGTAAPPAPAPPAAGAPVVNTRRPTVRGTAKVGRRLAVRSKGAWTPRPSSYAYQWLRNGKKISGATKSSYRITKKDRRKRISVRVSARTSGFPAVAATSKQSRRVS